MLQVGHVKTNKDVAAVLCSPCAEQLTHSNNIKIAEKERLISFLMSKIEQGSWWIGTKNKMDFLAQAMSFC